MHNQKISTEPLLHDNLDATLSSKAQAIELQRQLGHLHSQYDLLCTQTSTLNQGKMARAVSTSTTNRLLNTIDDSLPARNMETPVEETYIYYMTFKVYLVICLPIRML